MYLFTMPNDVYTIALMIFFVMMFLLIFMTFTIVVFITRHILHNTYTSIYKPSQLNTKHPSASAPRKY